MKIVYVFNDTRPSDRQHAIFALADDGVPAALTHFDDWTVPYAPFAMCCVQECDATGSNAVLVAGTRDSAFTGFNRRYGEGQWTAVWIDDPRRDPGCLNALRIFHAELERQEAAQIKAAREAAESVLSWLPAAFEIEISDANAKPTTH